MRQTNNFSLVLLDVRPLVQGHALHTGKNKRLKPVTYSVLEYAYGAFLVFIAQPVSRSTSPSCSRKAKEGDSIYPYTSSPGRPRSIDESFLHLIAFHIKILQRTWAFRFGKGQLYIAL